MHPHATLIEDLDGPFALARRIALAGKAVSKWNQLGVPWKFRPIVAQIAEKKGVDLPPGFLDPQGQAKPHKGAKKRRNGKAR